MICLLCALSLQDFSFYGNKVFQSEFIQILSPGASLLTTLLWTLLDSGCALVGCGHPPCAPRVNVSAQHAALVAHTSR